jgi:type VII secretion integral membrane protein EccD
VVPEHAYCRLTVLAPRRSVDVALPADVPVAELVPMVLELVGEPARTDGVRGPEPWRLSGIAGGPLPAAATLAELGVLDGEHLRIAPPAEPPAAPVFDDPVEALAAGAGTAGAGDRRFGSVAVLGVAVAAAALLAGAGPDATWAALVAGTAAVGALVHTARTVRATDPDAEAEVIGAAFGRARTTALPAVALAAAAGWTALPGPPGSASILLAVAAAGTAAAVAQVVLQVVTPALVATVVAAVLATAGVVGVRFGLSATAAAAAVGAVAVVAGPLLPRVAIRLAGLPRPVVPADGAELVDADDGPDILPPEELAERADLARGYLAGFAGACAVVGATSAVVTAAGGGWAGPAFGGVTVVVLGLRARGYADVVPARTVLVAAIAAGVALAALAAQAGAVPVPLAAGGLLLAATLGVARLSGAGAGREPMGSPVSRRAVDLFEGVLVAATVPLALAAMDLYRAVRGL